MQKIKVGLLPLLITLFGLNCIAQKTVGVTFTEGGKGAGIDSGLIDKTSYATPSTLPSDKDSNAEAVALLEFTAKENGSRDGYPFQISEVRISTSGTADIADLRFVLDGPGINNVSGENNGKTVTFKDFGDIIVTDGDQTGKTYQIKALLRPNIQGSLADNSTLTIQFNPINDISVASASSNLLQNVTAMASTATTITITATQLQGKNSFNSLTATATADFPGSQSIYATDDNGRLDTDFTELVTLSPHTSVCPNPAPGTLSSGEGGNLQHAAVAGIATWADLKYSQTGTIRIRASSTSITAADKVLCSAQVTVN